MRSALTVRSVVVALGRSRMPIVPYGSASVLKVPTTAIATQAAKARTITISEIDPITETEEKEDKE